MQHLEDFSEKVHLLPLVANRLLRMIQELDNRASRAREELLELQDCLKEQLQGVELKKNHPFTEEQKEIIQKIDIAQTEYYHLSEEKYKVSEQLEEEIAAYQKELSDALKMYNEELSNSIPEAKQSFSFSSPYKHPYQIGKTNFDYKERYQKE